MGEDEDGYHTGDDFNLEKESEFILEYLENFNELFDNGKYIQAAYYAAASPKNILRNIETLYKFKRVSNENEYSEEMNPLLVYCISLVDSVNEEASKPDADMSVECVRIVLKYNNVDILTRLIAQRRLTFSYPAAQMIEEYALLRPKNSKSLELVLYIYKEIGAAFEASVCMAKLGRFSAMMDFIKSSKSELASQIPDVFFKILAECPSVELANEVMESSTIENIKIPIDRIVSILLDSDQPENGLKFLKVQIQKNSSKSTTTDDNSENLKKLKVSYETLVKFSFLATEEDEFTKSIARETRDQFYGILLNNQKSGLKPGDNVTGSNCSDTKSSASIQKKRNKVGSQESMDPVEVKLENDSAVKSRSMQTRSAIKSHINMGGALVEEEDEEGS